MPVTTADTARLATSLWLSLIEKREHVLELVSRQCDCGEIEGIFRFMFCLQLYLKLRNMFGMKPSNISCLIYRYGCDV